VTSNIAAVVLTFMKINWFKCYLNRADRQTDRQTDKCKHRTASVSVKITRTLSRTEVKKSIGPAPTVHSSNVKQI